MPITTPQFPDPTEALRYIDDEYGVCGYDYVFIEDATWFTLCEIAHERGCTAGELCSHIDLNLNRATSDPFVSAVRRYILRYLTDIPDNIELPANFPVLRELRDSRRPT